MPVAAVSRCRLTERLLSRGPISRAGVHLVDFRVLSAVQRLPPDCDGLWLGVGQMWDVSRELRHAPFAGTMLASHSVSAQVVRKLS